MRVTPLQHSDPPSLLRRAISACNPTRFIDGAIQLASPRRGLSRLMYRQALQWHGDLKRNFEGARSDRLTEMWLADRLTADGALRNDGEALINRSRDLVRNNAYAEGALRTICNNVVGRGIHVRFDHPDRERRKWILDDWNHWCQKEADVTGHQTFVEMQSLVLQEMFEGGDVLVHPVSLPADLYPGRRFRLSLEMIEAERLAEDWAFGAPTNPDNGNEIHRGVEFDKFSRPVAYWVVPRDAMGMGSYGYGLGTLSAVRVPASETLHIYRRRRIGQTRGTCLLAAAIRWLYAMSKYTDNEMESAAAAACLTAIIKSDVDSPPLSGNQTSDLRGNRFTHFEPGMVAHLGTNEDITLFNPSRPNSQSDVWLSFMLRSIGVATGLSYAALARDFRQSTFSSNRAEHLEDRRGFYPLQLLLANRYCDPCWYWFMVEGALLERRGFPTIWEFAADPAPWLATQWQMPGWEWTDPEKQARASLLMIAGGLSNWRIECGKLGLNEEEVLTQLAAEQEMIRDKGLVLSLGEALSLFHTAPTAAGKVAPGETADEGIPEEESGDSAESDLELAGVD